MGAPPSGSGGHEYFGSAGQVITFGPVDILHAIYNGTTLIWSGPIMRAEASDGDGRTVLTTTIGTIMFYWGTATQNANPLLQSLVVNQGAGPVTASMPAFKGMCYAVLFDCQFGQQTTPPTLNFMISRFPGLFALDGRVTRLRVTAPGSGYVSPPAVSFVGGGGTGAAATAVLGAGGAVLRFIVTNTGSGYTSAPSVVVAGAADAQAYLFNELDGDCLLPEFLYECLTNTFWGLGIDPDDINLASFVAATETLIDEDIGASPVFDSLLPFRELAAKLLPYMDSVLFFKEGQIHMRLLRLEDTSGVPVLNESDFTDEPAPKNEGFEGTANFFRLTYNDRKNNWEDSVEGYDNPAHADIVGQSVDDQLEFPHVSRRTVAKAIVKREGLKRSKPAYEFKVRLQPENNTLHPGDLVKVTYAKLGFSAVVCRVMELERSSPEEPEVIATLLLDNTRDTTFDYLPPADDFATAPTVDVTGSGDFMIVSVTPRLQTLPSGLKGTSLDGFVVVFDNTDLLNRSAKILWTWDEVQKEYVQLGITERFPHYAELVGWHPVGVNRWVLRLRFPSEDFRNAFNAAAPIAPEWHFVTGHRTARVSGTPNTHELAGLWGTMVESGYFEAVDTLLHDIEVNGETFDAAPLLLETTTLPANSPTDAIYFGARNDFFVWVTNLINFERFGPNKPVSPWTGVSADTDLKRYIKVPVANHKNEQALSEVDAVFFDRDDTTMNPNGTYSRDWGMRAPTTAELFDLAAGDYFLNALAAAYPDVDDVDTGLGAIYDGTSTDTQDLLWNFVDDMLGAFLYRGIYTTTA